MAAAGGHAIARGRTSAPPSAGAGTLSVAVVGARVERGKELGKSSDRPLRPELLQPG